MDDNAKQIIWGTIMGGSSLVLPKGGKNYYLLMRSNDPLWLKWKMAQIDLFDNKGFYSYKNTYKVYSKCDNFLTSSYTYFYENNKRIISQNILELLRDIGLAVWFLDDGGKTGRNRKNAYLNAKKHGKHSDLILEYFTSLSLDCSINNNKRIIFSVKSTESFLKIIAPCFPEFMHCRLL